MKTIDLVLTHHWFDEIKSGRKRHEYRRPTTYWLKRIWDRRDKITHVRFRRGYTSTTMRFSVESITMGDCQYDGWDGPFIVIKFG